MEVKQTTKNSSNLVENKKQTFEEVNQEYSNKGKAYLFFKRLIDILISGIALVILSPIFILVWCVDFFSDSDKGPLLFKQTRMGLNGKKFQIYKFRSMVVNADKKLHDDKKLYDKYVQNNYKLKPEDDPRITRFGAVLRSSSIDEIPQFLNILKGEMTLIGPRPVVAEELVEYDVDKLLSVKPGAMGLWQASGRSKIGYPERAKIEMYYIDNAGLLFDFKILVKNVFKIFSRKGAY